MTQFTRRLALAGATALISSSLVMTASAQDDTIKVGVLHSLSGTMAISETTLKDTVEMLVEIQNEKGGLLGKQIEAVVVDPASDWPLFAEKARELITVSEVDVIFGSWTSVSEIAIVPESECRTPTLIV
ncbi:MAG: transporter substrate-binding protein, partial [Pseudomonadota bacterium]